MFPKLYGATATPVNKMIEPQNKLRIAIVGAGIAGLSAARALVEMGHEIHCFDKARGVGGRMSVRRQDGFEFDHGAQYFTARDPRLLAQLPAWMNAGVIAQWNPRVIDLRAGDSSPVKPQKRFVGVPGMTALARHLAVGLQINPSTRVAAMTRLVNGWKLTHENGSDSGTFDRVVISIPVVQARALLCGYPTLLDRIADAELEPCWAVMMGFDRPVDVEFDALFAKDSPLSWMARNNSKPGRSKGEAWVLHASPEWSKKHLEESTDFVASALVTEFARLTHTSLAPILVQAHRWRFARAVSPLQSGCVTDANLGITLCGDWCAGTRIEAAWLSGIAGAHAVV